MSTRGRGRGGGVQSTDRASSSSSAASSRSSSLTRAPSTTSVQDPDRLMRQLMTPRGVGSTAATGLGSGARPARQFTPNIAVSKKDKDKTDSTNNLSASNSNNDVSFTDKHDLNNGHGYQRGRGRGSNNRGGRGGGNYKQEEGIFGRGVPVPDASHTSASSSSSGSRLSSIKRESSASNLKGSNLKKLGTDKKTLVGDADGLKYEIDEENEPRLIPLAQRKSIFDVNKGHGTTSKVKEPILNTAKHIDSFVKLFSQHTLDSSTKTIVKDEPVEPKDLPKIEKPIINDPSQLILMQFPDVLPCTRTSSSSTKPELASLSDLPDGFLGKLQIFKSGKCRLKLNDDTYLDVDIGQPTSFLQNVMVTEMASTNITDDNGTNNDMNKLVCLGDIKHKLIVSLDAEHVLQDTRQ
ncbi:unnamed protein product [Rotaria socialis]|uniref:DNA-directed RNA polymerase III subunit RPC4 n=1 Tax=Rotaria socialis TaxID=392032 RepID=A0A817VYG5_9BILA|nr:unnamed protein product [Rotaria socialis]CAF3345458.1 unnamed protein product [Rotaria socialis]CAF4283807.1 unnamed protein product [Rotaria socialis]CAF4456030.1 unnamed protein product [Rotaria socialis]